MRRARASRLALLGALLAACSTTVVNNILPTPDGGDPDATADGPIGHLQDGSSDAWFDASSDGGATDSGTCPDVVPLPDAGENCTPSSLVGCSDACGAAYGYRCYNGGRPAMSGCRRSTADDGGLRDEFGRPLVHACCPVDRCGRVSDGDQYCKTSAQPYAFRCASNEAGLPDACSYNSEYVVYCCSSPTPAK